MRPKICSQIIGGLGNQMFQYAAGLSLARKLNADLYLDISGFDSYSLRTCALSGFDININSEPILHTRSEIFKDLINSYTKRKIFEKRISGLKVIREPHFHFWRDFYELPAHCYIQGYWQSPLYFQGIENDLSRVFNLKKFKDSKTTKWEEKIQSTISVAVHIRRGDYVRNPAALKTHGICGHEYYDKARLIINGLLKEKNLRFFVFSDDLAEARLELAHWDNVEFVSGFTQEQDLMLMSLCQHAIIANSSFSWWAAWLNTNSEKLIFVPRQWFSTEGQRERNIVDLFPSNWILI